MRLTLHYRTFFVLTALLTGVGSASPLSAQCPDKPKDGIVANPNRPTVADPADITQYGVLEVEYGYNHVMGLQRERGRGKHDHQFRFYVKKVLVGAHFD